MSDTMRRVQLYKRAVSNRPSAAKFQKVYLKNLVLHNKTKKAAK